MRKALYKIIHISRFNRTESVLLVCDTYEEAEIQIQQLVGYQELEIKKVWVLL